MVMIMVTMLITHVCIDCGDDDDDDDDGGGGGSGDTDDDYDDDGADDAEDHTEDEGRMKLMLQGLRSQPKASVCMLAFVFRARPRTCMQCSMFQIRTSEK